MIIALTVVILIIVASVGVFIYWRLRRPDTTIYAGETEPKDENEMGMVEVKSRYKLTDVYQ
jgi:capsular polysaccharide biosynthesis protein